MRQISGLHKSLREGQKGFMIKVREMESGNAGKEKKKKRRKKD